MKKTTIKMLAVAVAVFGLSGAYAQGTAMTAQEQELYKAAKAEGSLTWYTSQSSTDRSEAHCALFTTRYPDVKCNVVRATSQVIFQRLMQEIQAKSVHADVLSSNSEADFIILKKQGALVSYKPENLKYAEPSIRDMGDKDGYWITSNVAPLGIGYNTKLVKPEDAPKTWSDLLDPKWKNQVAIGHPGFSGSVGIWTAAMLELYGREYFEKMAKNNPQIGRSVLDGLNLVISGERKLALVPLNNAEDQGRNGAPIAVVYPTDGSLLPPSGSAVLKSAPHPNAARLFLDFALSKEASQVLVDEMRFPLRADTPQPKGIPAFSSLKLLTIPSEIVIDRVNKAKETFRDVFGI